MLSGRGRLVEQRGGGILFRMDAYSVPCHDPSAVQRATRFRRRLIAAVLFAGTGALLVVAAWLSLPLLRIWARAAGPVFAVRALLLHQLHLTLAAVTFAWVRLTAPAWSATRRQARDAS